MINRFVNLNKLKIDLAYYLSLYYLFISFLNDSDNEIGTLGYLSLGEAIMKLDNLLKIEINI